MASPAPDRRLRGLAAGAVLFGLLLTLPPPGGMEAEAWRLIAVIALMVVWWVSEAIPLAATALAPILLLPVLGITPLGQTTAAYAHPAIYLIFGGLVLGLALQKTTLPKRITLFILRRTGSRPGGIIFGFMLSTFLLSMWITNTATAALMLPLALSLTALMGGENKLPPVFLAALMIAIAFAANIGGMATLIGTAPNALLAGFLSAQYGVEISFLDWLIAALPVAVALLAAAWGLLVFAALRQPSRPLPAAAEALRTAARRLAPLTREEHAMLGIFALAVFLWIFHPLLPLPGLGNAGIAILAALLCFALPVRLDPPAFLLNWSDMQRLPWSVLLLMGGGLALAGGLTETGLTSLLGEQLALNSQLGQTGLWIACLALIVFLTEIASNTALIGAMLPVLAGLALQTDAALVPFLLPAVLASSCAFMLPTATPPNAIVFASGHLRIPQMIRAGFLVNLAAIALLALLAGPLASLVFGGAGGAE